MLAFVRGLSVRKIGGIGKVNQRILAALGVETCADLFDQRLMLSQLFSPKRNGPPNKSYNRVPFQLLHPPNLRPTPPRPAASCCDCAFHQPDQPDQTHQPHPSASRLTPPNGLVL